MWYFKSSTRRCEMFIFGGCEGNANKFQSFEECERTCYPYIDPNGKCKKVYHGCSFELSVYRSRARLSVTVRPDKVHDARFPRSK